jgi:hypothetical protein
MTSHPSCRSYTISGLPDELVGGTYIGGPCWPRAGQTWTIHFSKAPTTLYVYACNGYQNSISSGLLADGWQVVTAPNFEYTGHGVSHMWSKTITSGTSYSIPVAGTLVSGVFAAPSCSSQAAASQCIHAYMHTCIHAYMHTCVHPYMHTRSYNKRVPRQAHIHRQTGR